MIDRDHDLSVTQQARVLNISRSSVYYLPRPVSPGDLALMRRIDELHLDYPFAGSRMLRDLLGREGLAVGRLRVSTLMRRMGIEAIYRRPNTSKPAPGHKVYPYLLRKLAVSGTIAPIVRTAEATTDGTWCLKGLNLPLAGTWQVELQVLGQRFRADKALRPGGDRPIGVSCGCFRDISGCDYSLSRRAS
jgi:putative transposase